MKILAISLVSCVMLTASGCNNSQVRVPGINNTGVNKAMCKTAYFDSMPTEGWATDPNFSYRMYSYWPYNFQMGGFGPHGPESFISHWHLTGYF